jgi:predicted metal-dependent HD superfamily phosphohydrolase
MIEFINKILQLWGINMSADDVIKEWDKDWRYYHDKFHLFKLIDDINWLQIPDKSKNILYLVALFHDIVYDTKKFDNEEKSAEYFLSVLPEGFSISVSNSVYSCIIETKTHKPTSRLSKIFCELDMSIIKSKYEDLLKWENGIWLEYSHYGKDNYKKGRIGFLKSLLNDYPDNRENLEKLIDFVESS